MRNTKPYIRPAQGPFEDKPSRLVKNVLCHESFDYFGKSEGVYTGYYLGSLEPKGTCKVYVFKDVPSGVSFALSFNEMLESTFDGTEKFDHEGYLYRIDYTSGGCSIKKKKI